MTSGESEGRCPPPPPFRRHLALFGAFIVAIIPAEVMGNHECHACGKKAAGDAQGRTQAKGTALTGALKENAVLQSLAWKARQLRSRDGMLPDQLNLPNQLREINRRSEELRAMGAAASKPPKEERGTLHPRAAAN